VQTPRPSSILSPPSHSAFTSSLPLFLPPPPTRYNRGVYPSAVFERRRKYDVPVFMSRHPDLNLYIHEVLQAAGGMLMEGSIDKIVLTLYGSRYKGGREGGREGREEGLHCTMLQAAGGMLMEGSIDKIILTLYGSRYKGGREGGREGGEEGLHCTMLQAAEGMLMEGSIDKIILTLYGSRYKGGREGYKEGASVSARGEISQLEHILHLLTLFLTHPCIHSNNDDAQTPLESFAFELSSSPFLIQALAEGSLEDPFPAFRKILARISVAEVSYLFSFFCRCVRTVLLFAQSLCTLPPSTHPALPPSFLHRKSPSWPPSPKTLPSPYSSPRALTNSSSSSSSSRSSSKGREGGREGRREGG